MYPFDTIQRVYIACKNCRRRKVKCITSSPESACHRCRTKGLKCEYEATERQAERMRGPEPPPSSSGEYLPAPWPNVEQVHPSQLPHPPPAHPPPSMPFPGPPPGPSMNPTSGPVTMYQPQHHGNPHRHRHRHPYPHRAPRTPEPYTAPMPPAQQYPYQSYPSPYNQNNLNVPAQYPPAPALPSYSSSNSP
ncbi:hypothetical protein FB45DRAFT_1038362 [Roridomyces roridus]|uniref:Zn(2)-C6 fungal-type domain-containing protein n=1 Tax=Roridomyces roridus TaxID=1738132 RepID=A0AAD7B4W3_9AGAR|nr:hypothetical protein FB45DRAFT_1038362 [Roridomyces roridus]